MTITSITFTGTGYTISSNSGTINLGTGGLSVSSTAGAGTDAFNVGMVFLDPETFNVATSGQVFTDSLTMSLAPLPSTITGQGNVTLSSNVESMRVITATLTKGLTSSDTGTLTLSAANSYAGMTDDQRGHARDRLDNGVGQHDDQRGGQFGCDP